LFLRDRVSVVLKLLFFGGVFEQVQSGESQASTLAWEEVDSSGSVTVLLDKATVILSTRS